MIFPLPTTFNAVTLPETALLAPVFLTWLMLICFCALQYAGCTTGLSIRDVLMRALSQGVDGGFDAGPITGSTENEKNTYQCAPERGSTCGHGRWSATLRSGRRSPVSGTEKIQRIQR